MLTYAVIYASAGCLPDSDYPEFVGTHDECVQFIQENAHEYERPDVEHDLYALEIIAIDAECRWGAANGGGDCAGPLIGVEDDVYCDVHADAVLSQGRPNWI